MQYKFEEDNDDDEDDIGGGGDGDGAHNKRESSSDDGGRDSDFNPAVSDDDEEYSKPPVQSPRFVKNRSCATFVPDMLVTFISVLFLSINTSVLPSLGHI